MLSLCREHANKTPSYFDDLCCMLLIRFHNIVLTAVRLHNIELKLSQFVLFVSCISTFVSKESKHTQKQWHTPWDFALERRGGGGGGGGGSHSHHLHSIVRSSQHFVGTPKGLKGSCNIGNYLIVATSWNEFHSS